MLPIPEEYKDSICEIRTIENEMIATGIIKEITPEYIEIANKNTILSLIRFGTQIKINIFNYRKGIRVIQANVYTSSLEAIKAVDVVTLLDSERRNFFRLDIKLPAEIIMMAKPEDDPTAKPKEITIPIVIKNISLGGIMFTSGHEFVKGQNFTVRMELQREICHFKSTVTRITKLKNGKTTYGCRFTDGKEAESSSLCGYIFQKQKEQIHKRQQD